VEPEDEEEVGPPPSPGHFNNCVPVWLTASGQDEGRYSNKILSNVFYPYLTARYVKNQGNCIK